MVISQIVEDWTWSTMSVRNSCDPWYLGSPPYFSWFYLKKHYQVLKGNSKSRFPEGSVSRNRKVTIVKQAQCHFYGKGLLSGGKGFNKKQFWNGSVLEKGSLSLFHPSLVSLTYLWRKTIKNHSKREQEYQGNRLQICIQGNIPCITLLEIAALRHRFSKILRLSQKAVVLTPISHILSPYKTQV